ncbi:MAG: nuclear transport factor 2 family protein [Flavisolibacter sp.]
MPKKNALNWSETTLERPTDQKQIACQFLELVVSGKIDEAYLKFVSEKGKHHNPFFREGFPALKVAMKENHQEFPKKQFKINNVIGDGDLVAVHSHIILRSNEPGMAVVHLFRFQGDKIVEFWDISQPVPADSPNHDEMF